MANEQTEITKAQYEAISKQLSIMQETMDRRFEEWSEDRKTITDLLVEVKTVLANVKGARDDIAANAKKILDKIDERLQIVPDIISEEVKKTIDAIKNRKWYDIFKKGGSKNES